MGELYCQGPPRPKQQTYNLGLPVKTVLLSCQKTLNSNILANLKSDGKTLEGRMQWPRGRCLMDKKTEVQILCDYLCKSLKYTL